MIGIENRKSVGAVLFNEKDREINFLLVKAAKKKYWEFPKGKQEEDESEIDTLKREIHEETGIVDIQIVDDFRFSYSVDLADQKKEIVYYLARFNDSKIILSKEHEEYVLATFSEAKDLLEIPKLLELLDSCKERLHV